MTTYRLLSFQRVGYDEIMLPEGDSTFDNPAGPVANGLVATLAGGVVDTYGSGVVVPIALPVAVTWTGVVTGDGMGGDPSRIVRDRVDQLRGLVGHSGVLVRQEKVNKTEHGATALVSSVRPIDVAPSERGVWERVEMQFSLLTGWESTYLWDRLHALSVAGATGATVAIEFDMDDSNRPQPDVLFQVTAGSATITLLRVSVPLAKADWYWVGELAPGSTLRIDCGAMSVLQNGIDDYKGFNLSDNHKSPYWMQLVPQQIQSWMIETPPVMPPAIVGTVYYEDDDTGSTDAELAIYYRRAYQ